MENTQGGKDEFELKTKADKEESWRRVLRGKHLHNERKLETSDVPQEHIHSFLLRLARGEPLLNPPRCCERELRAVQASGTS